MKIQRLAAGLVLALVLLTVNATAVLCDGPQAPTSVRVSTISASGGINEGGAAGQASVTFEIAGSDKLHIDPSTVTTSIQAGDASHVQLNAAVIPIRLYSRDLMTGSAPTTFTLTMHAGDLILDNQIPVLTPSKWVLSTIVSTPISAGLSTILGRLKLAGSLSGGPATGFVCIAAGCVIVPDFAPTFGGQLVARVDLLPRTQLEAAMSAGYLVSLDTRRFGTDNYDAEAHVYVVHKRAGNEYFAGVQATEQNRAIKRADSTVIVEDRNDSTFGVVGINFDVTGRDAK